MLSPRLNKIIRDLYANRGRTILAILAITVSLKVLELYYAPTLFYCGKSMRII